MQMDIKIDGLTEDILRRRWPRPATAACSSSARSAKPCPRRGGHFALRAAHHTVKVKEDQVRTVIGSVERTSARSSANRLHHRRGRRRDRDDRVRRRRSGGPRRGDGQGAHRRKRRSARFTAAPSRKSSISARFVEILPGTEGLLHISQIAKERIAK